MEYCEIHMMIIL